MATSQIELCRAGKGRQDEATIRRTPQDSLTFALTQNGQPLTRFATFFKNYGIALALVTAAIPPILGFTNLVVIFGGIKAPLTGIASLGSYLLVAFIFSQRHMLARLYFRSTGPAVEATGPRTTGMRLFVPVPLGLGLLSLIFFFLYLTAVHDAVHRVAYEYATVDNQHTDGAVLLVQERLDKVQAVVPAKLPLDQDKRILIIYDREKTPRTYQIQFPGEDSVTAILKNTASASIPNLFGMTLFFLLSFLSAVSAFVLMGLREYLQEQLGLGERELIWQGH